MPLVLVDTNLLLLLIVGRTDLSYLSAHKRTKGYDAGDVAVMERLIAGYDGIVTTPHVLSETSNLLRQIGNPARDRLQRELAAFVLTCREQSVPGTTGCRHETYLALGLTDAVILAICETSADADRRDRIELLTADEPVYNRAVSLGLPAELYA